MLTEYIRAAMRRARYEILEDDGTFYGEIPASTASGPTPVTWRTAAKSSQGH